MPSMLRILLTAAAALSAVSLSAPAAAAYPDHPITLINPYAAGGPAVLRIVGVDGHLHFLNRGRRGHVGDVVAALVGVVRRAVEQELVVAILPAVHRPVRKGAVVERPQVDGLGVVIDARDQDGQRHRAA